MSNPTNTLQVKNTTLDLAYIDKFYLIRFAKDGKRYNQAIAASTFAEHVLTKSNRKSENETTLINMYKKIQKNLEQEFTIKLRSGLSFTFVCH